MYKEKNTQERRRCKEKINPTVKTYWYWLFSI